MTVKAILPTHDIPEAAIPWMEEVRDVFDEFIVFLDENRQTPEAASRAEKVASRVRPYRADAWYDWDLSAMARECDSEWVFIIERDERLSPEWHQPAWRELLANTEFTHFWLPRRWVVPGNRYITQVPWSPDWHLRLLRTDVPGTVFPRQLHEVAKVPGAGASFSHLAIEHHVLRLFSRKARERRVRYYEELRPGGGLGHYYLYEDHNPQTAPLPPVAKVDVATELLTMRALTGEEVSRISLTIDDAPQKLSISERIYINVTVRNESGTMLASIPPLSVNLAYHWLRGGSREVHTFEGERTPLPGLMPPQTSREVSMAVSTPALPGEYILQVTALQEEVCWFESVPGFHTREVPVTAAASGATNDGSASVWAKLDYLPDDIPLIAQSGLFQLEFYCKQTAQRFPTERDAIAHYIGIGWREGHNPSDLFDGSYYLASIGQNTEGATVPLLHYLRVGRRERRRPRLARGKLAALPTIEDDKFWASIHELQHELGERQDLEDSEDSVDIVIPVYRGYDATLSCIESVLRSRIANQTAFRVFVVEDASPDAALTAGLERLAQLSMIDLAKHETNVGFVRSANVGFAHSQRRDVLLLNSDTIVYGDWLDRLRVHARSKPRVATVTPLSNNATIVSYPYAPQNNPQELEVSFEELDRIAAKCNARVSVEIPTGVGFCFYVTRHALRELGGFDELRFGRGYGEENDFCMRASGAGWHNLAATDVFVRHAGEVSFGRGHTAAKALAIERLLDTYPEYLRIIHRFLAADPLKNARSQIDLERANHLAARSVLMIDHGRGGGTERHIEELAAFLREEGVAAFRGVPDQSGRGIEIRPLGEYDLPNIPILNLDDTGSVVSTLRRLRVAHVHVHSLVDYEVSLFSRLVGALRAAHLEYDFTFHDYTPLCPRIMMIDWSGAYCSSPSTAYCQKCVFEAGTDYGLVNMQAWRQVYTAFLYGARRIFVPDQDVAQRVRAYFPALPSPTVRPHPVRPAQATRAVTSACAGEGVTIIGIVGAIGPHKGSAVLVKLAADAVKRKLPVRFRLYGHSDRLELARFPNVDSTGQYLEEEIDAWIAAKPCHILFYPSPWPETFSFTLDVAFRSKIFPVTFDLGAPARRINEAGYGTTLPLALFYDPSALNDALINAAALAATTPFQEQPMGDRVWKSGEEYYCGLPIEPPTCIERSHAN